MLEHRDQSRNRQRKYFTKDRVLFRGQPYVVFWYTHMPADMKEVCRFWYVLRAQDEYVLAREDEMSLPEEITQVAEPAGLTSPDAASPAPASPDVP